MTSGAGPGGFVLLVLQCPHHDQNGKELVVMVKQGSDHTLRFDKLGYTPSTVSAVGRTRLIAAKQAVVDSAEALRLRAVEAALAHTLNLYEPQLSQLPDKLSPERVAELEAQTRAQADYDVVAETAAALDAPPLHAPPR